MNDIKDGNSPAPADWLARLAHDLRGPLTPMRMAAHMLQATEMPVQRMHDLAKTIDRQVGVLLRLTDELNDMVSIERDLFHFQLASYDLATIIENAADYAASHARSLGRELRGLEVRKPAKPIFVDAHEARLVQLIAMLMSDFLSGASDGSECWIECTQNADRAIVGLHDSARRIGSNINLDYLATGLAPIDPGILGMLPIIGREIAIAHGAVIEIGDGIDARNEDLMLSLPVAAAQP